MHTAADISPERLNRALRTLARIVAGPGGEVYIPLFERLEAEVAASARATDARDRARRMAAEPGHSLSPTRA